MNILRAVRSDISPSLSEGFTERLQGTYSISLYFLVAGILLWNTGYSSTHIACVCPAHFTGSMVDYANKLCWSKNTHYVPFNGSSTKDDPNNILHFNAGKYSGYVVIGLALLLLLPKSLWRLPTQKFGSSINGVFEAASDSTVDDNSDRDSQVAKTVIEFLQASPRPMYFTLMYMLIKLAYIVINIIQLVLIQHFLGVSLTEYLQRLIHIVQLNQDDVQSPRFPAMVLCDYIIRRLGSVHRYTVQCVIPVNQLYEKLWILFLLWVVVITIIGVFSLAKFILTSFLQKYHVRFIGHRLAMSGQIQQASDSQAWFFVCSYLGHDGFLILRLMSENVGEGITTRVVGRLWDIWRRQSTKDINEPLTLNPIT